MENKNLFDVAYTEGSDVEQEQLQKTYIPKFESQTEASYYASRKVASKNNKELQQEELFTELGVDEVINEDVLKKKEEERAVLIESLKLGMEKEAKELQADPMAVTRVVVGGLADSVQNIANFGIDVVDAATNKLGMKDLIDDDFKIEAISGLIPESDSTVEKMARGIVTFIGPFAALSKAFKGTEGASKLAKFGRETAIGAAVDIMAFDPDEGNLSEFIQNIPELSNPVSEYLATGNSRLEKRIKNAIEGALLGSGIAAFGAVAGYLAETTMKGLRIYKERRAIKEMLRELPPIPEDAAKEGVEKATASVSDIPELPKEQLEEAVKSAKEAKERFHTDKSLSKLRDLNEARKKSPEPIEIGDIPKLKEIEEVIQNSEGFAGKRAGNFSLSSINSPEDVRKILSQTAKTFADEINTARRGTITHKETEELAGSLGLSVEDMLARQQGQAVNAETLLAMREIMVQSASTLSGIAKRAKNREVTMDVFLEALDLHKALQSQFSGATAEAGRALGVLRSWTGNIAPEIRFDMLEDIMQFHGEGNLMKLAERISDMDPSQVGAVVRKSKTRRWLDAAAEVRVNSLLSSPRTAMVNVISNSLAVANNILETAWADGISRIPYLGSGSLEYRGQGYAKIQGLAKGWMDSWEIAKQSFKEGNSLFDPVANKLHNFSDPAISGEALGFEGFWGKGVDLLGEFVRMPGRGLTAADDFFKSLNYRMEVHAEWAKRAEQLASTGIDQKTLAKAEENFYKNVPMNVKMKAKEAARYHTFTNYLPKGSWMQSFEQVMRRQPLGRILFPFIRTNLNIANYVGERIFVLNPIMPEVRERFLAGGAARDMVIARASLGGTAIATSAVLAHQGFISGASPKNPDARKIWEQAGNQEYSIKVGDTSYAYNRLDPLGGLIGLGADLAQIGGLIQEKDMFKVDDALAASMMALGNAVSPEMIIDAYADLMKIIREGDKKAMEKIVAKYPSTFVPTALRDIRKDIDPNLRETRAEVKGPGALVSSMWNNIMNSVPGWSDDLEPQLNMFGEPILYPSGFTPEIISPIATRQKNPSIVYKEMIRLGVSGPLRNPIRNDGEINLIVSMPPRTESFNIGGVYNTSIDLTNAEYNEYIRLSAGIGLGDGVASLHDALSNIIKNDYPMIEGMKSKEMKRIVIRKTVSAYREAAKKSLLEKFPRIEKDFYKEVDAFKEMTKKVDQPEIR